jgi:hypothetical protein
VLKAFFPELWPADDLTILSLVFGVPTLAFLWLVSSLRIELNDTGIRVRRITGWDWWPWEDFEQGFVKQPLGLLVFEDKQRPFWKRRLKLELLSEVDRKYVLNCCLQHWQPVPPENIPDELELVIRGRWFKKTTLRMDAKGLEIESDRHPKALPWKAIESIEMIKLTPKHVGFSVLRIRLLNQELTLFWGVKNDVVFRNWRGPHEDVIALFLEERFPRECINEGHIHGDINSELDVEIRIAGQEYTVRSLTAYIWICFGHVILSIILVTAAVVSYKFQLPGQDIIKWIALKICGLVVMSFPIGLLLLAERRTAKKELEQLQAELTEWEQNEGASVDSAYGGSDNVD